MTEPNQEVSTSAILEGLHKHINACSKAEAGLKGMVGDMVGAGNGQGQPNPGLIIPGRPTRPPNGPNERQIGATSLQAEALLLQGQRLIALAVGTLLDRQEQDRKPLARPEPHYSMDAADAIHERHERHKQEHGTAGKVGDERGCQSPEAARELCGGAGCAHQSSSHLKDQGQCLMMTCDCEGFIPSGKHRKKATSQGSPQHGSSVTTPTAVNPSSGHSKDEA